MKWGSAYLFYYTVDLNKDKKHDATDAMPLAIITRPYPGGFMAINLLSLPNRILMGRVIEQFMDAMAEPSSKERVRKMLSLERFVRANKLTEDAFKFYSRSRIKGRIVEVSAQELTEIFNERILNVG